LDPLVSALVVSLGALSIAATLLGNGNLAVALIPVALAGVVFAAFRLPLRDTLPGLAFLCLTLENPSELPASGQWRSPLYMVGALLLQKMNNTLPVSALIFSGLDLALLLLAAVLLTRAVRRSTVDAHGYVPAAPPMRSVALGCLASIALVWAFGLLRGGNFGNSLWQIFRVIYLPCVLLLFLAGLRGPSDAGRLGSLYLGAALLRSVLAIGVRLMFPDTEAVPHATSHADSMLFAGATIMVLVLFAEMPSRRTLLVALGALPVLVWGMVANNRRLVWVELGLGLLAIYLVLPWNWAKRKVAQGFVLSLPLLLLYVGVGWSHPTGIFSPVKTIRSVVDSDSDPSTAWRDWENYNLFYTIRSNPVLGTGFGHEYIEMVHLPDVSSGYSLYRLAPHNSVLGLLAYCGLVGFAGIWMIVPVGAFFAVRTYRHSTRPRDRTAALTTLGLLVVYVVHCYGDMGLGTFTSVFTLAPALALVAKLAAANGAWPAPPLRAAPYAPASDRLVRRRNRST
jgi:hypothetical protein